jgi:hypothetical protein
MPGELQSDHCASGQAGYADKAQGPREKVIRSRIMTWTGQTKIPLFVDR